MKTITSFAQSAPRRARSLLMTHAARVYSAQKKIAGIDFTNCSKRLAFRSMFVIPERALRYRNEYAASRCGTPP